MILELQVLPEPKQIRFAWCVHLTDDDTVTLCGLKIGLFESLATRENGKTGWLTQPVKDCRRCQRSYHSAARTCRFVY